MVGVDSRTSPMKPTSNFLPSLDVKRLIPVAGKSVSPVAVLTTFADRYWKLAPGYVFVVVPFGSRYGAALHPSG